MNKENQPLVTTEPVEFEKWSVEVQGFSKNYSSFQTNMWNILKILNDKIRKITTCNRLDLETLGFSPVVPKHLPGLWSQLGVIRTQLP